MPSNKNLTSKPYTSERVFWALWDELVRVREAYGEPVAVKIADELLNTVRRKIRARQKEKTK